MIRDKESSVKQFRRLELTLKNLQTGTPLLKDQEIELVRELELAKRNARFHKLRAKEARKEIDLVMHAFLQQDELESKEKEIVTTKQLENSKLEVEMNTLMIDGRNKSQYLEKLKLDRELKVSK